MKARAHPQQTDTPAGNGEAPDPRDPELPLRPFDPDTLGALQPTAGWGCFHGNIPL
jgi:hypothetical protein